MRDYEKFIYDLERSRLQKKKTLRHVSQADCHDKWQQLCQDDKWQGLCQGCH